MYPSNKINSNPEWTTPKAFVHHKFLSLHEVNLTSAHNFELVNSILNLVHFTYSNVKNPFIYNNYREIGNQCIIIL